MDRNKLTEDERLIAEQAVATYRAVRLAGDRAPHGRGLAHLGQDAAQKKVLLRSPGSVGA